MSEPLVSDEQLAEWDADYLAAADEGPTGPATIRALLDLAVAVRALRDARAEAERLRAALNGAEAWFGAWECGCTHTERSARAIPLFCPEHGESLVSDDKGRTKVQLNHAGVSGYGFHRAALAAPTGQEPVQ
jgi:hypothetical protein